MIILISLIWSWSSYSQDSENKKLVKVSTLKNIAKEIEKCDSLRVRYFEKSQLLDSLVKTNLSIFKELDNEREQRIKIENQLQKNQRDQIKQAKKNKKTIVWIAGSAIAGLIAGVIISK